MLLGSAKLEDLSLCVSVRSGEEKEEEKEGKVEEKIEEELQALANWERSQ